MRDPRGRDYGCADYCSSNNGCAHHCCAHHCCAHHCCTYDHRSEHHCTYHHGPAGVLWLALLRRRRQLERVVSKVRGPRGHNYVDDDHNRRAHDDDLEGHHHHDDDDHLNDLDHPVSLNLDAPGRVSDQDGPRNQRRKSH